MNWDALLNMTGLASVIAEEYAGFRPAIQGALGVFLAGLPAARQTAMLTEQASLPAGVPIAERLALLARSCPALHKLGQVLARDRRLSAELRKHLQELESLPPSVPFETILGTLTTELGPLDRLGVVLAPLALAEASVAVVIPFRQDGVSGADSPRDGVFKILKPGIEDRLEEELELIGQVGCYLDQKCDDLHIPHLDYRESFGQVRDKLRHEVRLDLEQRHLTQARAAYADEPRVLIPALFEHCTRRVTAMERVTGGKVTAHDLDCGGEKRRLAELIAEALISRPIFAHVGHALFHGDPHAGNLFFTDDQRLAILDWSLVGSLGERERTALAQVTLGALTLDAAQILTWLEKLAEPGRIDRPALASVVHTRLARIRQGQFPGFTWVMGLMDEAVQTGRLRFGADLMLFRKMLHTLEGVVAGIGAGANKIDAVLLGAFLRHLVAEWPLRWLALPHCRGFATRLSNADLAQLLLSIPGTAARFWMNTPTLARP